MAIIFRPVGVACALGGANVASLLIGRLPAVFSRGASKFIILLEPSELVPGLSRERLDFGFVWIRSITDLWLCTKNLPN